MLRSVFAFATMNESLQAPASWISGGGAITCRKRSTDGCIAQMSAAIQNGED